MRTRSHTTDTARSTRPRVSRTRTALVSLFALGAVATTVAVADTAGAATFSSTARACFKQSNGAWAWDGPVMLQSHINGSWQTISVLGGRADGCHTAAIPDYYCSRLSVNHTYGSSRWVANSNYVCSQPGYRYQLGTYLLGWAIR